MKMICTLALLATPCLSAFSSEKVYVWGFSTRSSEKNEHTKNLTAEFEVALTKALCLSLLNRREFDQIKAQRDNESAIHSIESIHPDMISALKTSQATGVIFGEVFDDASDGQIRVQVTLQSLASEILGMASVRINRGKISDGESRDAYMSELANDLCKFVPGTYSTPPNQTSGAPGFQETFGNLTVTLKECRLTGKKLTCSYQVVSSEDARLGINSNSTENPRSKVFADGHEMIATMATLGSSSSFNRYHSERWANLNLIADIPANATLPFDFIPQDADTIDVLQISGSYMGTLFQLRFRNIPITK